MAIKRLHMLLIGKLSDRQFLPNHPTDLAKIWNVAVNKKWILNWKSHIIQMFSMVDMAAILDKLNISPKAAWSYGAKVHFSYTREWVAKVCDIFMKISSKTLVAMANITMWDPPQLHNNEFRCPPIRRWGWNTIKIDLTWYSSLAAMLGHFDEL